MSGEGNENGVVGSELRARSLELGAWSLELGAWSLGDGLKGLLGFRV
jgi:hypothetical protein